MSVPNQITDSGPVDRNFRDLDERATGADSRLTTLEAIKTVRSTVETLKVIRGIVNTAGSGSITKGSGFTITRNGTGDITITFTSAFSDTPAVTAMPGQASFNAGVVANTGGIVAASARLVSFNTSTGAATDGIIHFIAIGPT